MSSSAPPVPGRRSLARRYAEAVVGRPWTVLIGSLLLALVAGVLATGQRFHNPYEIWFLENDPALEKYRELTRQYGEDDFVIIAFRDEAGVFTNRALEAVLELTERLERTVFVERVDSIANHQVVRTRTAAGEEEIAVHDLVRRSELPLSAQELERRRALALADTPLIGSLLGPGPTPTTTALVARVTIDDRQPDNALRVVEEILRVTRDIETRYGYRIHLTGVPVAEHAFMIFGRREPVMFTAILIAIGIVLLAVILRDLRGAVLPCGIVVLAILGTLGTMAALGIRLNALTTIIPPILVTSGIAEAVHLMSDFFRLRRQGLSKAAAVIGTVEHNALACLITSVTTAVGFASLMTASIVPIRQLGLGASIGIVFAWVFSFTTLPAALVIWPERHRTRRATVGSGPAPAIDRALEWSAVLACRRPWRTVAVVAVAFLAIEAFAFRVRVETSYTNMFAADTLVRQGLAFVESQLGGSVDVEVSLDSGRSDGATDPAFLAKVESIQRHLGSQPEVSNTLSVVDTLKRINQAMHEDDPAFYRLPADKAVNAQYLLLYTMNSSRDDLKDRIDVDTRWIRLSARARVHSSAETLGLADRLRSFIACEYPELAVNVTGKALLYTAMHRDMATIAINSFLTASIPIAIVLALLFRSLTIGLLAMAPNVLPILAILGLMGLFDIPLDAGSAGVASIALGVVVDDTVHFFSRYLAYRPTVSRPVDAVRLTVSEIGRPVVLTAIVLAAGFSLFMLSKFNFIAYFGQLAACVIILALAVDLLLTPALLVIAERRSRRVRFAAGKLQPGPTVPLLFLAIVAAITVPHPVWAGPAEDRGRAIMEAQDRLNRGYRDELIRYRMTLLSRRGDRSERILEVRTLEGVQTGDKTLIVFKEPPDIKGTALLTHQDRKGGDDDQWLYLPAIRRVKRIAAPSKSSYFAGSELTYEDLAPEDLDRYQFRYVAEDVVDGVAVWVVERSRRSGLSGYSRTVLFVRKDNYQNARIDFYDRKADLLKTQRLDGWFQVDGKRWRARTLRTENVQTGKVTVLEPLDVKIGNGFTVQEFDRRALGDE